MTKKSVKSLAGVVLAGIIGGLLTLALTGGQPPADAQVVQTAAAHKSKTELVWQTFPSVASRVPATVSCPSGDIVLGGGVSQAAPGWVQDSQPTGPSVSGTSGDITSGFNGWSVTVNNNSADPETIYAVCAKP